VVFAFDGDRAGRAAAWRALQNALPEAREGRELRFLFLPDGEDPDSLVGREGSAAFEARVQGAVPLSEYLIAHLAEQADLKHADGRARYVALARPLLGKIPAGVYQELLLARIGQEVGMSADRLREFMLNVPDEAVAVAAPALDGARRGGAHSLRSAHRAGAGAGAGASAGRRGLIARAIQMVLHFPQAAAAVPDSALNALGQLQEAQLGGVTTLHALLTSLRANPARTTPQLLEEWRDHPAGRRLGELFAQASLLDVTKAKSELRGTIDRLLEQVLAERAAERYLELLGKMTERRATASEVAEFQTLMKRLPDKGS